MLPITDSLVWRACSLFHFVAMDKVCKAQGWKGTTPMGILYCSTQSISKNIATTVQSKTKNSAELRFSTWGDLGRIRPQAAGRISSPSKRTLERRQSETQSRTQSTQAKSIWLLLVLDETLKTNIRQIYELEPVAAQMTDLSVNKWLAMAWHPIQDVFLSDFIYLPTITQHFQVHMQMFFIYLMMNEINIIHCICSQHRT